MSEWKKYVNDVSEESPYVPKTLSDLFTGEHEEDGESEQPYTPRSLFDRRQETDEPDAYVPPTLGDVIGKKHLPKLGRE